MKKLLTLFVWTLISFTANAQSTEIGDVNGDGQITVTDVTLLVNYILGYQNANFIIVNSDVNGDGQITVTDVTALVNIILHLQPVLNCPDEQHPHVIDLGLPSGTKWACCNVDTDNPENQSPTNYGGYYAWGETETKDKYKWQTYTYYHNINNDDIGSDIAGTEYDVAHVKWKKCWQMPTYVQYEELINNCTIVWTTMNGVNGSKLTGPNGGSIFFPAIGYRIDIARVSGGLNGNYWSSTLSPSESKYACGATNKEESMGIYMTCSRYYGLGVRPVWVP